MKFSLSEAKRITVHSIIKKEKNLNLFHALLLPKIIVISSKAVNHNTHRSLYEGFKFLVNGRRIIFLRRIWSDSINDIGTTKHVNTRISSLFSTAAVAVSKREKNHLRYLSSFSTLVQKNVARILR